MTEVKSNVQVQLIVHDAALEMYNLMPWKCGQIRIATITFPHIFAFFSIPFTAVYCVIPTYGHRLFRM